jgi:hypothetical protein
VEFVEDQIWKNNICKVSLYTTLVEQKAYDAIRALIKKSIRTPIDFIESVVPTGQLDLIKHAHYSYPQFLFGDVSLLNVAIKTANLDVIKFVHEIMKRQYRQFRVSMLEFARTKNLEIVKFGLATFGRDIMWQDSIKFALSENLTDILEFLIDAGCPVDYWDKEKIEEQHPELHKRLKNREEERVQAHDYDFW